MYELLHDWKSSICLPDCESCTLSCLLPCHIYAMAYKPYYMFHFIMYAFVMITIYTIYFEFYYTYHHTCPSSKVDYCLGNSNCESHYMVVNGITTPCHLVLDVCTYSNKSCIEHPDYSFLIMAICLSYMFLFGLNYTVRLHIKEKKEIQSCESIQSTIPCGLAQVYREL